MAKRWKKKERSNSELWAATPKTVNILYLEKHERKYNADLQQINFNAVGFRENYGRKANKRNAMYAKKQRKLVKRKLFGRFTVCRTHRSLFDPLMMLVTSNKGWKSEKIKLVSDTLCHLRSLYTNC